MKILFAGSEPKKYRERLIEGGAKNGLESFWSLGRKAPPGQDDWDGLYLLDSGGYSAMMRGVNISVKEYADYLNKHKIKFAFNLDPPDNHESLHNLYYLQENTDTYIIPIFHTPEWEHPKWRKVLDYYIENYPYIALGGIAGREVSGGAMNKFLNYVFSKTKNKVMVHGLGCTRESILKIYPFYTVDSTSWMSCMRFGNSSVHSNNMAKVRARKLHYLDRIQDEIDYWLDLEKNVSRLWEQRGVKWDNLTYEDAIKKRTLKRWTEEPEK